MISFSPTPRIAVCQPLMQWSGDANADAVISSIAHAAEMGARVCAFPELAVPGFHRQIAGLAQPARVQAWLRAIEAAAADSGVAVTLGAPTFGDDGCIYNSQLFVSERGERLGVVEKAGLTAPEATFFTRGSARPVVALQGLRSSAVICREIEDHDAVCAQLSAHAPQVIYWPGLMGPEQGAAQVDPPHHVQDAQRLAQRLGAYVVQANWPNSLNYPELTPTTGRSAVIAPDGRLLFRLPAAEPGIAVFELGASVYEWRRSDAAPTIIER